MAVHIYNSLTKKKEKLVPQKGKRIKMYSCGVTVYDQSHIGHARSLYVFEVIRRYLKFRGYQVDFVRNITDIDDKIIDRARELNKKSEEVAKENIAAYERDLEGLGIRPGDVEPKATDNIPEMIQHIQGLIEKEYAYEREGSVYFRTRAFKEYGKLSGQSIDKMMEAVRIEQDTNKEDPLDFALWKKSKEDEPAWDSPWGPGRPGWHIECSCMSMKHLKTATLDIHAGGRDLIFPHHENEIAQSEALTGKPFAKYWIHHGLLTIKGQKMAKSLGNFITIQDALGKYGTDDLRLFFLSSHYASPIDFSDEKMRETHKAKERFEIFFKEAQRHEGKEHKVPAKESAFIKEHEQAFIEAMDDDFNTPRALGALYDLVNAAYKHKDHKHYSDIIRLANRTVQGLGREIFGIFEFDIDQDLDAELQNLLKQREEARSGKDFKRSDEIRDLLQEKGIVVEDTKEGQSWRWA